MIIAALGGCGSEGDNDVNNGNDHVAIVQSPDTVVASVDEEAITHQQLLEHMVITAYDDGGKTLRHYSEEEQELLRSNRLEYLITNMVIRNYIESEIGVQGVTSEQLATAESIAKRLRLNLGYERLVNTGEISLEVFEEFIIFSQYSNWFYAIVKENTDLSDDTVMAFYEANRDDFYRTVMNVHHILVITEHEAEEVMRRLENGEDFEDLAREISIDRGSAPTGGQIPEFGRGETYPEFEEAILGMKIGEIKGPVESSLGFHVIRLNDMRKEEPEFGLVRWFIEDTLVREASNQRIQELRQAATIVYFD